MMRTTLSPGLRGYGHTYIVLQVPCLETVSLCRIGSGRMSMARASWLVFQTCHLEGTACRLGP